MVNLFMNLIDYKNIEYDFIKLDKKLHDYGIRVYMVCLK